MNNLKGIIDFLFPSGRVSRSRYLFMGVLLPLGFVLFAFKAYVDYIMFGDSIDGPMYYLYHYFDRPWIPTSASGWEASPLVFDPNFIYVQVVVLFLFFFVLVNFAMYTIRRLQTVIKNVPTGSVSFIFALMVNPYILCTFVTAILVMPENTYQIKEQSSLRNNLLLLSGLVVCIITLSLSNNVRLLFNDIYKSLNG